MNKEDFLKSVRNYIEEKNIVDFEEENEIFTIDAFDILNSDNSPVLADKIIIKNIEDKIEVDFICKEQDDRSVLHKTYNTISNAIFIDIYEEIVFLNFFNLSKKDYIEAATASSPINN